MYSSVLVKHGPLAYTLLNLLLIKNSIHIYHNRNYPGDHQDIPIFASLKSCYTYLKTLPFPNIAALQYELSFTQDKGFAEYEPKTINRLITLQ